ncbi:hypothetical protein [Bradyrhizobium sp. S3.9.1]|uniref:hypothetical protein n=1 Tax=Bradyrhizobium sp. S3.9.1 TaxID=3156431 RepID=UPI0033990633
MIELLPLAAADKLRALRQRSADAHAVIPEFADIQEASVAKIEAANALKRLTAHPQDFGFDLKPDDPRVIAAQRTLNKATDDFERIKQRSEVRTAAWQAASGALANVETWLKGARPGGTALEECEWPEPKLLKGETVLDAIERLRRRGRELKADLHRIRSAPFPSSHAKAQMREQIEALAQRGAPSVSLLIEHDRDIAWPKQQMQSAVYNAQPGAIAYAEATDAVALFAWTLKDQLIKRLDAEIDAEADDKAALSHEARQKAEAETMGDLLAVERDESRFVWSAMEHNLPVQHRADCSQVAIMQCQLVTAPRADASPRTSPGLSWPWLR